MKVTCIIVVCFLFTFFWGFFFGRELIETLNLYRIGSSSYSILNLTIAVIQRDVANTHAHTTNQSQIPLILMHRMWRDESIINDDDIGLPTNWTKAFNYCSKIYHDRNWTTILWTDESILAFMKKQYASFLPVYESYPYHIQRVDAARYFILYHFGGVYLDLDVGCKSNRDLSDLVYTMTHLNKTAMLPQTQPFGLSNDVMFASKRSPLFKEAIEALSSNSRWFGSPYLTVMYSTGPMFVSLVYNRLLAEQQKDVLVIPPELYSDRKTRYFKHLRGSTWHSTDAFIIKWMMRHWLSLSSLVLVLLLVVYIMISRLRHRTQKHDCNKIV